MAKMDTIRKDDPFKTDKLEQQTTDIIQDAFSVFDLAIRDKLQQILESNKIRENETPEDIDNYSIPAASIPGIVKKILDAGLEELQTDDLIVDTWEYTKKGYLKGLQYSSIQLKQLGIKVNINMGDPAIKKTLDSLQENLESKIITWQSDNLKYYHDLVVEDLKNNKSLMQIYQDLDKQYKTGLVEAKKLADQTIIEAARAAHVDTLLKNGIEIYRWIAVLDDKTCGVCIALAGRIYKMDTHGRGIRNLDTGDFLSDELKDLAEENDLEGFIDTDSIDGPPIHFHCRCFFQPAVTEDQYKGNQDGRTITEIE